jgi:hypothetical protein
VCLWKCTSRASSCNRNHTNSVDVMATFHANGHFGARIRRTMACSLHTILKKSSTIVRQPAHSRRATSHSISTYGSDQARCFGYADHLACAMLKSLRLLWSARQHCADKTHRIRKQCTASDEKRFLTPYYCKDGIVGHQEAWSCCSWAAQGRVYFWAQPSAFCNAVLSQD